MIRTGNEKTGNSLLNIPVKAGQIGRASCRERV